MPALLDRIGKAWGAFQKKKELLTSKHLSMKSKRQIYETYILPVAMHASETMTWNNAMLQKIDVFNNHVMRWMLGVRLRDKTSIAQLRKATRVKPILPAIKSRKLAWFGHIKRSTLPVRTTFEGLVEGRIKQGRPRRRWRDDVEEWCEACDGWDDINNLARDREKWRSHCNAFC